MTATVIRKRSSRSSVSSASKDVKSSEEKGNSNEVDDKDGGLTEHKSSELAKAKSRNRALFNKLKRFILSLE